MKNFIAYVVIILGGFFSYYGIIFNFLPINTLWIFCMAVGFFFLLKLLVVKRPVKLLTNINSLFIALSPFLFTLLYVIIALFAQHSDDLLVLSNSLYLVVSIIFMYLFYNLPRTKFSFKDVVSLYMYVAFLQGVCIILYYFSQDFKSIMDDILPVLGNFDADPGFRSRGFSNVPGASLSVLQAVGLFCSFYIFNQTNGLQQTFQSIIVTCVIVLSIFLSGRTGLLSLPICALFFVCLNWGCYNRVFWAFIKLFVNVIIFSLFAFLLYNLIFFADADSFKTMQSTFRWIAVDFFPSDIPKERKFGTWKKLLDMLVLPDDKKDILFGSLNGFSASTNKSDVGYIKNFWALGIFGSLLYYGSYFFIAAYMLLGHTSKQEKVFIVFVFGWLFVTELKEPFFRSISLNTFLFMIFFSSLTHRKRNISSDVT